MSPLGTEVKSHLYHLFKKGESCCVETGRSGDALPLRAGGKSQRFHQAQFSLILAGALWKCYNRKECLKRNGSWETAPLKAGKKFEFEPI